MKEFNPKKEADRVSDILIKTIFPMETENKGNKTPEEYLEETAVTFSYEDGTPAFCNFTHDADKALELARTEEREKLIREAIESLTTDNTFSIWEKDQIIITLNKLKNGKTCESTKED